MDNRITNAYEVIGTLEEIPTVDENIEPYQRGFSLLKTKNFLILFLRMNPFQKIY